MELNFASLASKIDYTVFNPDADYATIDNAVLQAIKYKFASVCVNPVFVSRTVTKLKGSNVGVTALIGFPLGATFSSVKAFEVEKSIQAGATEIDMVINIGAVKSHDYDRVFEDIKAVRAAAGDRVLKVILETGLLENEEIFMCSKLAMEAKADFIVTNTGYFHSGANAYHVALIRKAVGLKKGVKAAGGITNLKEAMEMIEAGANRIGCSLSADVVSSCFEIQN